MLRLARSSASVLRGVGRGRTLLPCTRRHDRTFAMCTPGEITMSRPARWQSSVPGYLRAVFRSTWSYRKDSEPPSARKTWRPLDALPTILRRGMERLWSPAGATSGNQRQSSDAKNARKQAKTVAVGCDRLPPNLDGKEGSTVRVRQRALQKSRKMGLSFRKNLHDLQRAVGMEPFMEPSG
jgi:hypothetical protein